MFAGYKTTKKAPQKFQSSNASSANIPGTPLVGVTAQTFIDSQEKKKRKEPASDQQSPATSSPASKKKRVKLADAL